MPATSSLTTPDKPSAPAGVRNFLNIKKRNGIFQGSELVDFVDRHPSTTTHLVDSLLPARSVNILVGDSGIGKSPLAYQLGLSVASGVPFLGLATTAAKVLLIDFENSPADARNIMEQQRNYLGLAAFPHTFQVWPMHLNPLHDDVLTVVEELAPTLVIIDSLRSFQPKMESDHTIAVELIKQLRAIAASHGTAFLMIHHVRKGMSADDGRVMDWLVRSAGSRALVNQTDLRLGVTPTPDGLMLRGNLRTQGDIGPWMLQREGDATCRGYRRQALDTSGDRDGFTQLPEEFRFKDAMRVYGKARQTTNQWIHRMIKVGLVTKTARGRYLKASSETIQ